jgi:hypothetical protein
MYVRSEIMQLKVENILKHLWLHSTWPKVVGILDSETLLQWTTEVIFKVYM